MIVTIIKMMELIPILEKVVVEDFTETEGAAVAVVEAMVVVEAGADVLG